MVVVDAEYSMWWAGDGSYMHVVCNRKARQLQEFSGG
jgi:hypothetical protein